MVSTAKGGICDCFQNPGFEASEIGSGKRFHFWHERARDRTGVGVNAGGDDAFNSDSDTTSTSTSTYLLLQELNADNLIAFESY